MVGTMEQQLKLEVCAVDEAKSEYHRRVREGDSLPPHFALIRMGFRPLANAIRNWQQSTTAGRRNGKYRVLLRDVPAEDLAFMVLWVTITELDEEPNASVAALHIGRAIQEHLEYLKFKQEAPAYLAVVEENLKTTRNKKHRGTVIHRARKKVGIPDVMWDAETNAHIGATFMELLITSTGMFEKRRTCSRAGNMCYAITPSEATRGFLERAHAQCSIDHPWYLPCVIPPKPWTEAHGGGYYSNTGRMKLDLVRSRQLDVQTHVESHVSENIYSTINIIQETPWQVNRKVLEVAEVVWRTTNGFGIMPKAEAIELPETPWTSDDEFKRMKKEEPEKVKEWKTKASEAHFKRSRATSKALAVARTIARARRFVDYEAIYFPWSLDWRGRAYPITSFLNPQGEDLAKGMLQFADEVPLGVDGVWWLKVHGANCWAGDSKIDKAPLPERVKWIEEHEAEIIDSGTDPLDGARFWTGAEDPWQFLAFCFEYTEWVKCGRNIAHPTRIPVSVDGSCNGLQHFAALGRDMTGGAEVNLTFGCTPADVYTKVALRTQELIVTDMDNHETFKEVKNADTGEDERISFADMARVWHEHVDRKLVKRNVMTIPYGVTNIGMREQLAEVLQKRIDKGDLRPMDRREMFRATVYLALRIADAVCDVMPAVKEIMGWIRGCASLFNEAGMSMTWTAPHGFPVLQKYIKSEMYALDTYWGKQRVRIGLSRDTTTLNGHKQTGGSAPNFVHSMDACHLFTTVDRCVSLGIRHFAMVHDSYGVHAANAGILSRELRLAFDDMYAENHLMKLYSHWKEVLPETQANKLVCPSHLVADEAVHSIFACPFFA